MFTAQHSLCWNFSFVIFLEHVFFSFTQFDVNKVILFILLQHWSSISVYVIVH